MAIEKARKKTPFNKALKRARTWCDREAKGEPAKYNLCWRAQAVLIQEMEKAGLGVVPVKAWKRLKKKATRTRS